MGNARYNNASWSAYSTSHTVGRSRQEIFTQETIHQDLDPKRIQFREAVDSEANPATTPIILAADETGSMGVLAEQIIRGSLGEIMNELYSRTPVTDPQIACAGIGDVFCDRAPLQVTQFEAAAQVLGPQVQNIYLEGNGGGNNGESYPLVWLFAANKVVADAWRVRNRKGYIFTIGDEQPHTAAMTPAQIRQFAGIEATQSVTAETALRDAQNNWDVFHLIVKPVTHQPVVAAWEELLGDRAILVDTIDALTAAVVSAIEVNEGQDSTGWTGPAIPVVERVRRRAIRRANRRDGDRPSA